MDNYSQEIHFQDIIILCLWAEIHQIKFFKLLLRICPNSSPNNKHGRLLWLWLQNRAAGLRTFYVERNFLHQILDTMNRRVSETKWTRNTWEAHEQKVLSVLTYCILLKKLIQNTRVAIEDIESSVINEDRSWKVLSREKNNRERLIYILKNHQRIKERI